ncbi:ficolin-2-like [Crassostrea virginica]
MSDFKKKRRFAYYRIFYVGDMASGYKLTVGEYHGNAGDSLTHHNGASFHTTDRDVFSCSQDFKGGWWYRYKHCHYSNLSGEYLRGDHASYADGVNWFLGTDIITHRKQQK